MKKIYFIFLCLALMSLACLSTAVSGETAAAGPADDHPTLTNVKVEGPRAEPTLTNAHQDSTTCAIVIADEALHVRSAPSADDIALTWLNNNDVVHVLDITNAEWWKVRFNDVEGFARSIYLAESDCGDNVEEKTDSGT